ncbi:MAG: calcium/sodium antiporter [Rikenellaceae bacterium]|nr:calcium/sodium antiporter [Rikenellaceae bacterium]
MDLLLLLVGLALILGGGNYLTDGASALAQRLRMPEFLIGMTIVAIGTSMPELVVSVLSSMKGQPEMAIGNVVGSNVMNICLILGLCAVVRPIAFTRDNIRFDIPFTIAASLLLIILALDTVIGTGMVDTIGRGDGILMLALYIALMIFMIRHAERPEPKEGGEKPMALWLSLVMIVGGLGALIYGGDLFLDSATNIALKLGVSESVIALTLVAGGTSLPELAASLISLIKGKSDMALGNILGSNIMNILGILGISALIQPLPMGGILPRDLFVVLMTAVLVFLSAFTFRSRELDRAEGGILLAVYAVYIYILVA